MTDHRKRTYEELLKLDGETPGGLWSDFMNSDLPLGEVTALLTGAIERKDHQRAVFYAEKIADFFEGSRLPEIVKRFRKIQGEQEEAYARTFAGILDRHSNP